MDVNFIFATLTATYFWLRFLSLVKLCRVDKELVQVQVQVLVQVLVQVPVPVPVQVHAKSLKLGRG